MAETTESEDGLYNKYIVSRSDGGEMSESVFVLDPYTDATALTTVLFYAELVSEVRPELSADLKDWIRRDFGDRPGLRDTIMPPMTLGQAIVHDGKFWREAFDQGVKEGRDKKKEDRKRALWLRQFVADYTHGYKGDSKRGIDATCLEEIASVLEGRY